MTEHLMILVAHSPGGGGLDPAPLVLAGLGSVYVIGAARQARATGKLGLAPTMAFGAAFVALAVALVAPIEGLAETAVAWHMVQHLLLVAVAAPLLVAAQPAAALAWALPRTPRKAAQRGWRHVVASTAGRRWYMWAVASLIAYVTVMWAWHLPVLYNRATADEWTHGLEHVTFVAGAFAFWWALTGTNRRREYGVGVLVLFAFSLSSIALGAMLTFAGAPLYELGHHRPRGEVLQDQQVAGVLMWGYGGVATAALAMGLFASWLRWHERRATAPIPRQGVAPPSTTG